MSIHDEMDVLADAYAGGGLAGGERLEVERHAAGCGACAAALRDARDFSAWLKGMVAPDAPPLDLEDRIVGRLWKTPSESKPRPWLMPAQGALKILGGLAAAVLLVVIGSLFTLGGRKESPIDELTRVTTHSVDYGVYPPPGDELRGYLSLPPIVGEGKGGITDGKSNLGIDGAFVSKNQYARDVDKLRAYNFALDTEISAKAGRINDFQKKLDATNIAMTKMLADQDVLVRQLEVQLAQAQEIEESRNKLAKAVAEKSLGIAEPKDERKASERLQQDLAKLENKHVEVSGENILLEERIYHLNQMGQRIAGVKIQDFPGQPPEAIPVPLQDNRKVIRNARVDLEVESYAVAHRKIAEIVAAEKGFIAGADTERLPNNKIKAVVTLRVPPERFEAALARLGELGTVRHQSVASQDVTKAYVDLEARMGSKQALVDRLKKILAEAKGNAKELMEVEVQMGKTIEEIESIKGELKYYDSQVALSTIVLNVAEKDLGQPFEYVQTLQSTIGLTVRDPDDAYARAQKEIVDAGGQVVDSKMTRQNDGSAQAAVKGRVDAGKFPAVREELRKLGHVDNDTVDQQKTARGGSADAPRPDAPLRREQATIDLTLSTPPILVTRRAQVAVEAAAVKDVYESARKAVEDAGGRITAGSLTGQADRMGAVIRAQVEAGRFAALVDQLKALGKVKNAGVSIELPAGGTARPITERAELEFVALTPPGLIPEEKGLGKAIRDTFSGSVAGLLWSVEKLFVGICLAGPWLVVPVAAWIVWRRRRKARAAQPPA